MGQISITFAYDDTEPASLGILVHRSQRGGQWSGLAGCVGMDSNHPIVAVTGAHRSGRVLFADSAADA